MSFIDQQLCIMTSLNLNKTNYALRIVHYDLL